MLTYLDAAPKLIVYDFACSLEVRFVLQAPTRTQRCLFAGILYEPRSLLLQAHQVRLRSLPLEEPLRVRDPVSRNEAIFTRCFVPACRCCKAFRMDNYEDLHGLNSSIAEQYHSYLRRLREMAKHMRLDHFMLLLRVFINLWNVDKLQSIE